MRSQLFFFVFSTACCSLSITSIVSIWRLSGVSSIGKIEKSKSDGEQLSYVLVNNSLVENCGTVSCHNATASSFVAKFRGKILTHFRADALKRYSGMRNWLFGLPGRSNCEQSPSCEIKWWACSWHYSSPVSTFSFSVNLDFSIWRIIALPQVHYRKSNSIHQC
jgi:hypothetical protein